MKNVQLSNLISISIKTISQSHSSKGIFFQNADQMFVKFNDANVVSKTKKIHITINVKDEQFSSSKFKNDADVASKKEKIHTTTSVNDEQFSSSKFTNDANVASKREKIHIMTIVKDEQLSSSKFKSDANVASKKEKIHITINVKNDQFSNSKSISIMTIFQINSSKSKLFFFEKLDELLYSTNQIFVTLMSVKNDANISSKSKAVMSSRKISKKDREKKENEKKI
jgi:hypothetical protein